MDNFCPICRFPALIGEKTVTMKDHEVGTISPVDCPRCGSYQIKDRAKHYFETSSTISNSTRAAISRLISDKHDKFIDENTARSFTNIHTPKLNERIHGLLYYILKSTNGIGEYINIDPSNKDVLECTYSINDNEVIELLTYLEEANYINSIKEFGESIDLKLTTNGMLFIEDNLSTNSNSTQGFVAMWFDASMTPIYDSTIAQAISKTGYTPHRVDRREHAGKVDDEIIAQIRRSKFVVADFTGHRGGVYYEAGFAHGLGLPVIMTCQEDQLDDLHFDIRQYNCILWNQDNLDIFQERLKNRIEAILGRGPLIHEA